MSFLKSLFADKVVKSIEAGECLCKTKSPCEIKVLGSGCQRCKTLFENTKRAVAEMNLEAGIEYITDLQKVMVYGVMSMPGLVINDKVISSGRVLTVKEIEAHLEKSEVQ